MKCKACNKDMTPRYNSQLQDWEVCGECLVVVRDYLESFKYSEVIPYQEPEYTYNIKVNDNGMG